MIERLGGVDAQRTCVPAHCLTSVPCAILTYEGLVHFL